MINVKTFETPWIRKTIYVLCELSLHWAGMILILISPFFIVQMREEKVKKNGFFIFSWVLDSKGERKGHNVRQKLGCLKSLPKTAKCSKFSIQYEILMVILVEVVNSSSQINFIVAAQVQFLAARYYTKITDFLL